MPHYLEEKIKVGNQYNAHIEQIPGDLCITIEYIQKDLNESYINN